MEALSLPDITLARESHSTDCVNKYHFSFHGYKPAHQLSKRKILKNVAILSLGFMLLFTSMNSLQNLQSTLNKDKGLGTAGLSVAFGGAILSSLFLQNIILHYLGYKWTIPFCMMFYIIYMCANLYSTWWTIIPSAALVGLFGATKWISMSIYLTEMGIWYADLTDQSSDVVISQFFSVFYGVFQISSVFGNIISSVVLVQEDPPYNATNTSGSNKDYGLCGANYCPWFNDTKTSLRPVEDVQRYIICGTYIAIAVIGVIVLSVFLDAIKGSNDEKEKEKMQVLKRLMSTMKQWRHLSQILLIPLSTMTGLITAFIFAEINRSYVGCIMGVQYIGYAMISHGVGSMLGSILIAVTSKKVGRIYINTFCIAIQLGCSVFFLFWESTGAWSEYYILLVLYGCYGMSELGLKIQISVVYGSLFPLEKEAAFANNRLFQAIGFTISFAYSDSLCTDVKLYITISLLVLSLLTYLVVEVRKVQKEKRQI